MRTSQREGLPEEEVGWERGRIFFGVSAHCPRGSASERASAVFARVKARARSECVRLLASFGDGGPNKSAVADADATVGGGVGVGRHISRGRGEGEGTKKVRSLRIRCSTENGDLRFAAVVARRRRCLPCIFIWLTGLIWRKRDPRRLRGRAHLALCAKGDRIQEVAMDDCGRRCQNRRHRSLTH